MKKLFLALAGLVALTQVSCVKDESTYVHITNVKGVVINEVYTFSNQSEADDLDWIELYNTTAADIDLTDVLMWEGGGAEEAWAFPKGSIIPANGYFVVECDKYGLLNNPKKHPAWGLSKGPDEVIVLANSDQKVIDEIALPSLLENETYGRTSDGDKEWKIFKNGTKGVKNEGPGRDEFENTTGLFVNEVYHDNSDEYVADGWDASVDFVEFYNANDTAYDISGYSLYDEKHEEEDKYIFPEGTIVPAKGFLTFDIDKDDPTNPSLSLGAGGDWLFLYDKNGVKVEEIEIPAFSKDSGLRDKGYTFGRQPDGSTHLVIFTEATKNASNNDAAVLDGSGTEPEQPEQPEKPSTGAAKVVFNELCGNKVEWGGNPANKFIELYNAGEGDGNLAGWTIRKYAADATDVAGKYNNVWVGPEGTTIAAGAYIVLGADATDYADGFTAGLSAKKGVKFELVDAEGNVVDRFIRGEDADPFGEEGLSENKEASYSRVPNGTGSFAYAVPTPGAANGEATGDIEGYTAPEDKPTPEPAKEAKVVFNELCGNKVEWGGNPANKFIELYNAGEGDGNLAGWTIRKYAADATDVAGKYNNVWVGPEGTTIAAGAYIVLGADATDYADGFTAGLSAKKGVKFELVDAAGNVVDRFIRGEDADPFGEEGLSENKEASYSRVPNGTGSFAYAVPTPGAANGESTGDIEGYTAPEA